MSLFFNEDSFDRRRANDGGTGDPTRGIGGGDPRRVVVIQNTRGNPVATNLVQAMANQQLDQGFGVAQTPTDVSTDAILDSQLGIQGEIGDPGEGPVVTINGEVVTNDEGKPLNFAEVYRFYYDLFGWEPQETKAILERAGMYPTGDFSEDQLQLIQEGYLDIFGGTLGTSELDRLLVPGALGFDDIDTGEVEAEPTDGVEQTVFDMLRDIMSGTLGTEDVDAETIAAINNAIDPSTTPEDLEVIAQEIQDAGGWQAWLESQGQGGGIVSTVTDSLSNWWEDLLDSIGQATTPGSSTPPTLPGSVGVIIDPTASATGTWSDILSSPGSWQVFLPGVIPGLPESPTIIGTIEDILNKPKEVLSDLMGDLENAVQNPGQVLRDILEGVADEEGMISVAVMGQVVQSVMDVIRDNGGTITNEPSEEVIALGGDGEDDTVEVGGSGDIEESEEQIGGAGGGGGGGGGGGQVASRPSFGEFTPFMRRIQYQPVAVPKAIVPNAPVVSSLFEEYLK